MDLVSLYFHLPFCTKKCDYCHFYVLPDKADLKDQLLEGLLWELQKWAPKLTDKKVISIYFGGGTPALFGPQNVKRVLEAVHSITSIDPGQIEITLEANPENITKELITGYAEVGINRISIGIQTLDDPLLKRLGRIHSAKKAIDAVFLTNDAGISNISIDLMYDIPGQTLESWQNTLHQITSLPITHLSLYNLTIEPNTVFFKYQQSLLKLLPDAESSKEMYLSAVAALKGCNLQQYEISAFAKDNCYSRHNIGYWTGRPFLGFGPSGFSYWENSRFRNVANLSRYHKALKTGVPPIDFTETLDPEKGQREMLAIALRLLQGVNLDVFETKYGILDNTLKNQLKMLEENAFLKRQGKAISLTEKGILFYDTVAVEII